MKLKYVGKGNYIQGLPATDLDTEGLTEEQMRHAETGLNIGLYVVERAPAHGKPDKGNPARKVEGDEETNGKAEGDRS